MLDQTADFGEHPQPPLQCFSFVETGEVPDALLSQTSANNKVSCQSFDARGLLVFLAVDAAALGWRQQRHLQGRHNPDEIHGTTHTSKN